MSGPLWKLQKILQMVPRRRHYWVVRFAPAINFLRRMERFEDGKLQDFFRYYDPANPNHIDAVNLLQEEIESLDPDMMADYASWVRLYRNKKPAATGMKFTPFLFEKLTGYSAKKFSVEFCHDCSYLFEETVPSAERSCLREVEGVMVWFER